MKGKGHMSAKKKETLSHSAVKIRKLGDDLFADNTRMEKK